MAEKHTYIVHRTMMGDKEYQRGETRELTAAEAAPLIVSGALSKEGEEPQARDPAVQHTFGARKSEIDGYTSAAGESVKIVDHRPHAAAPSKKKA